MLASTKHFIIKFFCYFFICMGIAYTQDSNEGLVKNITQPEESEILKITMQDNEQFAIFSNVGLHIGETGIIVRDLSAYKAIVANVVVTQIKHSKATAKILPFTQLVQPYLPTPNMQAEVGDRIIFRSFNNKAFLIAPNEESYRAVVAQYPFIEFVNSDLLMGFLNSQGKHDPTEKTLPKACNEYAVGLVFVVASKNIGILNCQNVALLTKYPHAFTNATTKSPFYTRTNFEGGGSLTYSLSSKKSKNYFLYYDAFIGD